ncbi:roadblock/LC7 domain-containing protein [Anaeromyxobacter paludicola]|uniref:GTPase n=1 Tax=Anaeromyxobacter paludicola TaxID=2918171 RepID=A0ABN6NAP5_9BACT|nr:hypothetical protein [Anaeromyxobacter paludicola]BDG09022.1 GTPase [Anaeromyxobacter paludicola]
MSFREHLQGLCKNVDGAVGCALMATDGIEVETHLEEEGGQPDLRSLLIEYATLFRGAAEASRTHGAGEVSELSIATDQMLTVARMVSPEYFMVVALRPDGNFGKARYLLRLLAPKLRTEL